MHSTINVDPESTRNAAVQCRRIQMKLDNEIAILTHQLIGIEQSLQGAQAQTFMAQLAKWKELSHQLSDTLDVTSKMLTQIADEADSQIAALQRLSGL